MDGELLATDAARFATLKKLVDLDLADRREWFSRAEKNRTERFKRTNTKKPVYDGAPNLVDPIIDDLIRELKQSCVTTLWQAPRLAQFIGLDETGVANAENAEAAFDFHLRHTCKTRSRISQIVDDEGPERGDGYPDQRRHGPCSDQRGRRPGAQVALHRLGRRPDSHLADQLVPGAFVFDHGLR